MPDAHPSAPLDLSAFDGLELIPSAVERRRASRDAKWRTRYNESGISGPTKG